MTLPFLTGGVGLFRLARESGLNAPFGARCFLTPLTWIISMQVTTTGLNAPYGAWCFLTKSQGEERPALADVLMHLMALGAF